MDDFIDDLGECDTAKRCVNCGNVVFKTKGEVIKPGEKRFYEIPNWPIWLEGKV